MVADTNGSQLLYSDVLDLFRSLRLQLPAVPPLMLVDRQALNEQPSHTHGGGPLTRGMTLAEESRYAIRSPRLHADDLSRGIRTVFKRRGPFLGTAVDSFPVEYRERRVTAILILFGLPRLLTGSILAHECMHAYLKLANKIDLSPTVEEGLCQLMAYLWVEKQKPEVTSLAHLNAWLMRV